MSMKYADFDSTGNVDYKRWQPKICNVYSYLRIFRISLKQFLSGIFGQISRKSTPHQNREKVKKNICSEINVF